MHMHSSKGYFPFSWCAALSVIQQSLVSHTPLLLYACRGYLPLKFVSRAHTSQHRLIDNMQIDSISAAAATPLFLYVTCCRAIIDLISAAQLGLI
jgi:hypothetical protein